MTPENFAYWLQGYVELTDGKLPDKKTWKHIIDHLNLLFKKETPLYSGGFTYNGPVNDISKINSECFLDGYKVSPPGVRISG